MMCEIRILLFYLMEFDAQCAPIKIVLLTFLKYCVGLFSVGYSKLFIPYQVNAFLVMLFEVLSLFIQHWAVAQTWANAINIVTLSLANNGI